MDVPSVLPLQVSNPPFQALLLPLKHPMPSAQTVVPPEPAKLPNFDNFLPIDVLVCSPGAN
eukprot:12548171-Prorocentrum_lima.AAC.1